MQLPVQEARQAKQDPDAREDQSHAEEPAFLREGCDARQCDAHTEAGLGQIELIVVDVQGVILLRRPFGLRPDLLLFLFGNL